MSCWGQFKSDGLIDNDPPYSSPSDSETITEFESKQLPSTKTMPTSPVPNVTNIPIRNTQSSDYDTPPWRVDEASSPSVGFSNSNMASRSRTMSSSYREPEMKVWKIGPPLLPQRTTATETYQNGNTNVNHGTSSNGDPFLPEHNTVYEKPKFSNDFQEKETSDNGYRPTSDRFPQHPGMNNNGKVHVVYESIRDRQGSTSTRTDSFSSWKPVLNGNTYHNNNDGQSTMNNGSHGFHNGTSSDPNGQPRKPLSEWAFRPGNPVKSLATQPNITQTQSKVQNAGPNGTFRKYEYTFGKETKLKSGPFPSDGFVDGEGYFEKVFQDMGFPSLPNMDHFTSIDPQFPPQPKNGRSNTIDSSGYGSITPPLLSSLSPSPDPPPAHTNTIKGRPSKQNSKQKEPDFNDLSKKCAQNGVLFRDPEFAASNNSIYFSRPPTLQGTIEWKRPFEITKTPEFVSGGSDRFDVVQGQIGNCWLVSAIAGLTLNPDLLDKVCPNNQSFDKNYSGLFRFRFWRFGKWVEIAVDDRLPTIHGQLIYVHSAKPNEFWSALLEKAYAKVMGSYESLEGGCTSEGFTDLTGGIVESLNLRNNKNHWNIVQKSFQRGSFMGCGIDAAQGIREQELANGLVCGHAYSITGVREIQLPGSSRPLRLIRLRNPWGSEHEWKGAWSDRSPEWQQLPASVRQSIGLNVKADGEFWMSFEDFRSNFNTVDLCHLPPDANGGSKKWEVVQKEGTWEPGVTSGGCMNYRDTFSSNPQYRISLSEPDDGDQDGLCTLIVSITQKNRRKRANEGLKNLTIGYSILKPLPVQNGPITRSVLDQCEVVGSIPNYVNSRDISHRHELPPGDYVVIPSTFKPNVRGEFLLRMYTEKTASHQELDEETGLTTSELPPDSPNPTPVDRKKTEAMEDTFRLLAGEDGEIDAWDLRKALNQMFTKEFPGCEGFEIEAARSMIARNDGDMTGTLTKEEFLTLYKDLNRWKKLFKDYDVDESGTMDIQELRGALNKIGLKLSNRLLVAISRRYSNKQGKMDVKDFVVCICRVQTMINTFQANQHQTESHAKFSMEEFMISTVYS